MNYSPQQQAIIQAVAQGDHDIQVVARAGCGKTTTILAACEAAPGPVAFFAFNKSIATELEQKAPGHVQVQTLHSYGFRAVRNYFGRVQVDADKVYKLLKPYLDQKDDWNHLGSVLRLVSLVKNVAPKSARQPSNDLIADLADQHDIEVEDPSRVYSLVRAGLLESIEQTSVVDFDDMVFLPALHDIPVTPFRWVFLDEAQDVNETQMYLVQKAAEGGRLCFVGDPKQAIYGFRGADEAAMDTLAQRRGGDVRVYPLTQTYRCPHNIVREVHGIVPDLEAMPSAPPGEVLRLRLDDIAPNPGDMVLSRVNAPLVGICMGLIRQGVPAKVQGRDIGANVLGLAKRLKATSLDDLRARLLEYLVAKTASLQKRHRGAPSVLATALAQHEDQCMTLDAVIDLADSLGDLENVVKRLFGDMKDARGVVLLSSIHKAKGLEAEQVYYLQQAKPLDGPQEANLRYVAITRAKDTLVYVTMPEEE